MQCFAFVKKGDLFFMMQTLFANLFHNVAKDFLDINTNVLGVKITRKLFPRNSGLFTKNIWYCLFRATSGIMS